jgi:hypothetical protein
MSHANPSLSLRRFYFAASRITRIRKTAASSFGAKLLCRVLDELDGADRQKHQWRSALYEVASLPGAAFENARL